ncbi:uncharacterized protein LOC119709128 isoform X5 [Motacilla alba alba]|uniref:uncharacterized protein LOC119709128 isoform X5 n=1 Tax=Motacilla alba alba TaxID=1094192 RepID=UPI0018D54F69|nr:uncharacterized protein LOC119709128 isoform X5 [Motacilla alba alba]
MQLWAEGVEYQERQAWSTQPCPGSCCDTWQTPGILRQVDTVVCIAQAQLLVQTLVQSLPATAPTARHTLRMGRGEERGRGGWRAHRSRSGGSLEVCCPPALGRHVCPHSALLPTLPALSVHPRPCPSLQLSRARLDGDSSSLLWRKVSLPLAGGLELGNL